MLLELQQLKKSYTKGLETKQALAPIDLLLDNGESLGIVGMSGSGKSTLLRLIALLEEPTSGAILVSGHSVSGMTLSARRRAYEQIQMVFQHPGSVISPRMTIGEFMSEPYRCMKGLSVSESLAQVNRVLEEVDLTASYTKKFAHEVSGGELQRIVLGRVVSVAPKLVLFDEPTSALDPQTEQGVLTYIKRLQREHGFASIFVSHNIEVVEDMATRIVVMKDGCVVDTIDDGAQLRDSAVAYTQELLRASLLT
jgi:oligopeptide transport system ATP-binding protein